MGSQNLQPALNSLAKFGHLQGRCWSGKGTGPGQERAHQPLEEERQQEQAPPRRRRQEAGQGHVLMMSLLL